MKNEIAGELALVTGAGTGIGKAIAVRLAQLGCDVVLVGRTVSKLEATAAEVRAHDREAYPMACDLTDADAIERLVADVKLDLLARLRVELLDVDDVALGNLVLLAASRNDCVHVRNPSLLG